ncbi:MAG: hypothetical protein BAJALOKI3v1_50038 [Promethearchaeota archaeon]|nr:MAG: hypothetical protein BAJALOKI3v1_50038 [Candidatus Lokiarchaeota archaeon]
MYDVYIEYEEQKLSELTASFQNELDENIIEADEDVQMPDITMFHPHFAYTEPIENLELYHSTVEFDPRQCSMVHLVVVRYRENIISDQMGRWYIHDILPTRREAYKELLNFKEYCNKDINEDDGVTEIESVYIHSIPIE